MNCLSSRAANYLVSLGFHLLFPHTVCNSCQSCRLQSAWEATRRSSFDDSCSYTLFLFSFSFRGEPPLAYIRSSRVFSCTMSSGSAQDVAVEHFLRDIERRSKRLHCTVIGCEEERSCSDMNLLYRKSRLDWRQKEQEGSKKRWVAERTGAPHVRDYSKAPLGGNLNLLVRVKEVNFKILIPSAVHKVKEVSCEFTP